MKIFNNKERKQIFLSSLLLVIILALYIELNVLVSKMNIKDIDITEDMAYSVSAESIEKISNLDKDVKVYLINFEKYEENTYLSDVLYLLQQYEKINGKITLDLYKDDSEENKENSNPYIIFESEGRTRVVTVNELYQYKYNTEFENQEELSVIEPMITNSILNVANNNDERIYICLNKSVYKETMYTSITSIIGTLGMETYALDLEQEESVPEKCTCLIIPPLVSADEQGNVVVADFSEEEKNKLVEYINRGGNLLFLQESKTILPGETPNLNYIMGLYGFKISDGIICQDTNRIKDIPSHIYPEIKDDTIYKSLKKDSKVCFFDAGRIELSDDEQLNVSHKILLEADHNAYLRKDLKNNSTSKTENDVDAGNSIIAAYAEKSVGDNKSKAIIYSNSVVATNSPIFIFNTIMNKKISVEAILLDDNVDMIADSIKELSNQNNSIYLSKNKYNLVPSRCLLTDKITLKIIFVIPMIIVLAGYVVWRHRKNKK